MKYLYKQTILTLFIIVIICGAIFSIIKKDNPQKDIPLVNELIQPVFMCYYHSNKTERGFYDASWIKMKIKGNNVSGEFQNLPAEKNSKVGKFEGTVGPLEPKIMSQHAIVWWNSLTGAINLKEELLVEFGEGSANVAFGEMIDRGDGVYVYIDKNNLFYSESMGQIACQVLDEKLFVEKYVRENISTLAINEPVLGGNWYIVSIFVNPIFKTVDIIYEDGHIQSQASLIYIYEKDSQDIMITGFEIKE